MKIVIHRHDAEPIEIEGERVRVTCGRDHYEMREQQGSLLVRIEEHDGSLAMALAVFPNGGNSVRLRGGLR